MEIDYILMAVAGTIWLLVIGRIIGGITAATASAYIADISKPEDKSTNFGLIGTAFGIGFVLGPLMRGYCQNTAHAHIFGPQRYWRGAMQYLGICVSKNSHRSH